jgi:hypothetical protein
MNVEDRTVAEMTATQLKNLIQSAVKEALEEILKAPDADLELRPEFEERLRQAAAYVASGGHLLSMEELTSQVEGTRLPSQSRSHRL